MTGLTVLIKSLDMVWPASQSKSWFVCRLTFSRQYWLVWQYWQRVWKWFDPRLRTRFGELVVLLFIFNIFRYFRLSFILSLVCFRATVGEFAVLLFLGTSPCSPSARLSACCRNQSFPENREKHHQKRSFDSELRRKSMLPTPRIQLPVRPFVREIIGWIYWMRNRGLLLPFVYPFLSKCPS